MNGFVERKVKTDTMPVIVEYELTPYSQTLKEVTYALIHWGVLHREKTRSETKQGLTGQR